MARLQCPQCSSPLHEVKVQGHYSNINSIIVDQCSDCGSIWFDGMELFSIKHSEAQRIENLDVEKLKKYSEIPSKILYCPRDKEQLTLLQDAYFPKQLQVERCKKCGGFWLNRGEFHTYQTERKKLLDRDDVMDDPEFAKQVRSTLQMYSKKGQLELVGRLGKLLSTPVDMNGRPIIDSDSADSRLAGLTGQAAIGILGAILNVLARKSR